MCTTFVECKTIITVVLMVMSGMDPHMITRNWDRFGLVWLVLSKWVSLRCGSVTVRLHVVIEVVTLRRLRHRISHCFL
jgi:hypothetical protein